ncbi:hypothetical protein BsWGS_20512 [Bradybaena similaris]
MASRSDTKRRRLYTLAVGLLAVLGLIAFLWMSALTAEFSNKLYDYLIVEKLGSLTGFSDDTNPQSQADQGLEVWRPNKAIRQLRKYNRYLNHNAQPMTADPNNTSSIRKWWQAAAMITWYLKSPRKYKCRHLRWYGNWGVCQDEEYSVKPPCLVYSFGIAFDFSFDDAMGRLGCDVRSFDPSMGRPGYKRSRNVRFYALGIGSTNTNSYRPKRNRYVRTPQIWKVRTLAAIRRQLGHSERVLDVLKLDIEAWEWSVLDNIMETNLHKYVRHLLVEYHLFNSGILPRSDYVLAFQTHTRLKRLGFHEYLSEPHDERLLPNSYNQQAEVFYVNSRFNLSDILLSDLDSP